MDNPRAWLTEVATEEVWNDSTLPRINSALDELGIEVERRGESVCIRDDRHCETVTPGETSVAIDRLLDDERQRLKHKEEQDVEAKRLKEELKQRESKPFPQHPKG